MSFLLNNVLESMYLRLELLFSGVGEEDSCFLSGLYFLLGYGKLMSFGFLVGMSFKDFYLGSISCCDI